MYISLFCEVMEWRGSIEGTICFIAVRSDRIGTTAATAQLGEAICVGTSVYVEVERGWTGVGGGLVGKSRVAKDTHAARRLRWHDS